MLASEMKEHILGLVDELRKYAKLGDKEKKAFRHQLYQQTGRYGKMMTRHFDNWLNEIDTQDRLDADRAADLAQQSQIARFNEQKQKTDVCIFQVKKLLVGNVNGASIAAILHRTYGVPVPETMDFLKHSAPEQYINIVIEHIVPGIISGQYK